MTSTAIIPSHAAEDTLPVHMLPEKPNREQIERLIGCLLRAEAVGAGVELPTGHDFAPGVYGRSMFIAKGTCLVGGVHKTEHLSVFSGDITVWTEDGMRRLTGYHVLVSKPGAQRVGYAHEDTWCTGFFPSDKTSVDELERDLVENPEQLQCNRPRLGAQAHPTLEE